MAAKDFSDIPSGRRGASTRVALALKSGLLGLTLRYPRLGLALGYCYGRIGGALAPDLFAPPEENRSKWARLTGIEDRKALRKLRARRSGDRIRRHFAGNLFMDGRYDLLQALIRWESPEHISNLLDAGRPVIAATWHVGPFVAHGVGMRSFGKPVTLLIGKKGKEPGPENLEILELADSADRVRAFRSCVDRLREGGIVAMTGDNPAGREEGIEIGLLNSRLPVRRGLASLSRRTRAPIVPVSIAWSRWNSLIFTAHPPLPTTLQRCEEPETFERNVLREFAEVADAYFRRYPHDIGEGVWSELVRKGNRRRRQD